jgi:hypothetical protein
VSYARFASPHQRLKPITRRPNPQVSIGLHSRGGSELARLTLGVVQQLGADQSRGYSQTNGWHFSNQGGNNCEVRKRENNSTGSGGENERDTAVGKGQSLPDLRTARTSSVIWTLDLRSLHEYGAGGSRLQETPARKRGGRACLSSIDVS